MKNDKSIVLDLISREDEEEWFEFKENWFEAHEIGACMLLHVAQTQRIHL